MKKVKPLVPWQINKCPQCGKTEMLYEVNGGRKAVCLKCALAMGYGPSRPPGDDIA